MPRGHQVEALHKRATALKDALADLGDDDDLSTFLKIIRRPGWTTVAEYLFVSAILESMLAHATALSKLKGNLLKGSQAVSAE